jgi:hypothetical protein
MALIGTEHPLAVAAVEAIQAGDVPALRRLLVEHPDLATVQLGDVGVSRTLLHVATDWPGFYPNGPAAVAALIEAGADVDARFVGPHAETPLHWAASSDDVEVLDVLLDAGADIEATGAVVARGTALDDAVAFGQWQAARRLVERGARPRLWHAAALGLLERLAAFFEQTPPPSPDEVTYAFWSACDGGQLQAAAYLFGYGADPNWVGYDHHLTPLAAARRAGADALVAWLYRRGGRSTGQAPQATR